LDLRFNDAAKEMEIAPFETDHAVNLPDQRARALPPTVLPGKRKRRG